MKFFDSIFLIFVLVSSCSGAQLSSTRSVDSKRESEPNGVDVDRSNNESPNKQSASIKNDKKPIKAIPPEEVTGSYLACDVFDSSTGTLGSKANIGCNAYLASGTKFELGDVSSRWNLTDKSKKVIPSSSPSTASSSFRYQMSWSVDPVYLVVGFDAQLELNVGLSAPLITINQNHAYDRVVKHLSDGRKFSTIASLPFNGLRPDVFFNSTLSVFSLERPVNISNYSVRILSLDPSSGLCSTNIGSVNLALRSSTATEDIFNMNSSFLGSNTYFCLEIQGTFMVNGRPETAIVYQR